MLVPVEAAFALRSAALGMAHYFTLASLGSLLTLTALETVLGIDNVIFLSILVAKLPKEQQPLARRLGLVGALGMRIGLLFTLSWLAGLTKPFFTVPVWQHPLSGRDLVLLVGGGFLVVKSLSEIKEGLVPHEEEVAKSESPVKSAFAWILIQIVVMDIVFSLDSVITAVGLGPPVPIMISAMILSMIIMLWFAGPIGDFVERHPSMKVLALSFLVMIGVLLVIEGVGHHIDKAYLYFAMGFAFVVELVNIQTRKAKAQSPHA
jgi:predicted tellurium resistance membrane protein TerC